MTALMFPAEIAVGEIWWEDAREPDGSGHRLAIGVVEVPDGDSGRPLGIHGGRGQRLQSAGRHVHGPGRDRVAAGSSAPPASSPPVPGAGYLATGNARQRAA
jgi:hypothetical protein